MQKERIGSNFITSQLDVNK